MIKDEKEKLRLNDYNFHYHEGFEIRREFILEDALDKLFSL
jgi:hypothetical protein